MPEIIQEQDPKNSAIANRLQDDQETDNRPLGDVVIGEYQMQEQSDPATKVPIAKESPVLGNKTSIIADQIPQQTVSPIETATGKKTRVKKVVNKPVGGIDVKDLVQKLTNQAAVAMWVDNLRTPEILDTLVTDKSCRDIMISFQKAIDKAKSDAIIAIQSL